MIQRSIESYRRRLLAKEQEVREMIASVQTDGRQPDDLGTQDLADQANNAYHKETLFQHFSAEHELLAQVRAALDRLEKGQFGKCLECGQPVEKKRLDAVPWTSHCVACQEAEERGLL